MNKRPRMKLQLNQTDKILEVLGWVSVVGIWALPLTNCYITGNNSYTLNHEL